MWCTMCACLQKELPGLQRIELHSLLTLPTDMAVPAALSMGRLLRGQATEDSAEWFSIGLVTLTLHVTKVLPCGVVEMRHHILQLTWHAMSLIICALDGRQPAAATAMQALAGLVCHTSSPALTPRSVLA